MLEIKDLTCGYDSPRPCAQGRGSKVVLQDINLRIENGEFLGVVGPNGSGKTTLLRAITRIIKPKKGVILLEGKNIWLTGLNELAKEIAVVSQNPPLNHMPVEEFVLLGRIPHYQRWQFLETKKDREMAERSMRLTDTFKLKDRLMGEVSGGERQLVVIARALCQEPRLLLLDEPTAHLDITHQAGILNLIKKLNKDFGLTVIMVLHDLNLASQYCDRLILLNNGIIHKTGRPEEVLTYQTIEEVYKTLVVVEKNPVSSKPYIFLVSSSP